MLGDKISRGGSKFMTLILIFTSAYLVSLTAGTDVFFFTN